MAKSESPRPDRPKNFEVEQENQRVPAGEGESPRPATEPPGAERTAKTSKTATDPATGAPQRPGRGS